MVTNSATWRRIADYRLDDADMDFSFSRRLIRENAWSPRRSANAISEYKRFIYLSAISARALTPPDDVDQAWRLHLIDTRDYWGPFTDTVGKPIHHDLSLVGDIGSAEQKRLKSNYSDTMDLYRREFEEAPPKEVWPQKPKWSAGRASFARVDISSIIAVQVSAFSVAALTLVLFGTLFIGWVSSFAPIEFLAFGALTVPVAAFVIYFFLTPDWYQEYHRKNSYLRRNF